MPVHFAHTRTARNHNLGPVAMAEDCRTSGTCYPTDDGETDLAPQLPQSKETHQHKRAVLRNAFAGALQRLAAGFGGLAPVPVTG